MGKRRKGTRNRMQRGISQLTIYILIFFCPLFSLGTYEILNFPQDARSLSLHNAATSYDSPFLRNNPAAVPLNSNGIIYSYLLLPANIHSGEIQKITVTCNGARLSKLSSMSYGPIIDSETNEKTTSFDIIAELGYKKEVGNIISIGISGGYLMSSIAGYHSQLIFSKIGIRSRMMRERIGMGFSLENIGFVLKSYTDVKEAIPILFRSSVYYRLKYLPTIISIDLINNINENNTELSGGIEFNFTQHFNLRLGCSSKRVKFLTNNFSSDWITDISGGIGFKVNTMNLDIGFMNLGAAGYVIGFSMSKKLD